MLKFAYAFSPAMLLAAGGLAAPASAAVVTQNYGYNPLAEGSSFNVSVGHDHGTQFNYNYSNFEGPKATFYPVAAAGIGPSYATFTTPDGTENYSATQLKVSDSTADQYVLLRFDLQGQTTYGTALFTADSTLKSITYDSTVPEPAVWAELIAGFALAGNALRVTRRRRQAVAAR